MQWSNQVSAVQGQWRSLLEQDPDQAIEALAERHAVGGGQLVDSGLQAFQEQDRYVEITSFQLRPQVPQAPPGAPPAKAPTVATPTATGPQVAAQPKDPPPRSSQLGASAPCPQDDSGPQASTGQQDPWHGWHSGLLGQDGRRVDSAPTAPATKTAGPSVYNSAPQAAAKARGLQPGTVSSGSQGPSGSAPRSPPAPSSEQQLMPDMSGVPSAAWGRDLGYCHGCPVALLGSVGLDGELPPMQEYRCFQPLRRNRPRTISAKLANKGFSLNGFCLLNCSEACGFACSRPVAFGTRRGHAHHQCPTCHP